MKKIYFLSILLGFAFQHSSSLAQQITFVDVISFGIAQNEEEALTRALVSAISQINGVVIASKSNLVASSDEKVLIDSKAGKSATVSMNSAFKEEIDSKTKGVVKSWKVIGSERNNIGEFKVQVAAQVFVLQKSPQLDRIKIAVIADAKSKNTFTDEVINSLSTNLVKSRKYAVIDRKNSNNIQDQLNRIKNGEGGTQAQVRLGADLVPDILAVVSIDVASGTKTSQRVAVNLEIIDYASRQIKFSERKFINVKSTEDDVHIIRKANLIANSLYQVVLTTTFPPLVIGGDGEFITISQGGDYFKVEDKLIIKKLGPALRDPHTGEFLSYDQSDIGEAKIIYVDARISRARITKLIAENLDTTQIASNSFQVFRVGQKLSTFFDISDSTVEESLNKRSKKKNIDIFSPDDNDDD